MDYNSLLVIILAFMLGCMCSEMMKQMCGQRLVEGKNRAFWWDCDSDEVWCGPDDGCLNPDTDGLPMHSWFC